MNLLRAGAQGRRESNAARASSVELTPLIDVVFLLLIFFMVSTTFVRESALDLVLPEAKGTPFARAEDAVEVLVSAAGDYAVDGRRLEGRTLAALIDALEQAERAKSVGRVVVAADADARHAAVMRVLDAAGRLGLSSVRIAAQVPPETEGGRDDNGG